MCAWADVSRVAWQVYVATASLSLINGYKVDLQQGGVLLQLCDIKSFFFGLK